MDDAIENEIRELLASNKTVAAIKLNREKSGVNLAEARTASVRIPVGICSDGEQQS